MMGIVVEIAGWSVLILGGLILLVALADYAIGRLGFSKHLAEVYWQYLKNKNKRTGG